MFGEMREGTGVGAFAGALIEAFSFVAAETVSSIIIDKTGDVRVGFLNFRYLVERDAAILVAEIEDHRAFRRIAAFGMNTAAIEGRCCREAGTAGRRHP